MKRLQVDVARAPRELRKGLNEIVRRRPGSFGRGGLQVRFERLSDGNKPRVAVSFDQGGATVRYGRMIDAFRGLGRVMAGARRDVEEQCAFDLLGLLVDC